MEENYLEVNKQSWNNRAEVHFDSEFYDNKTFLEGRNSLNEIELALLGDVSGKTILHLQCHFGQDSISLSRMGADVTGVDFSDVAIDQAQNLAKKAGTSTKFICCDVYSLQDILNQKFDIVFTSYGTIGWLPDIKKWANVISNFLKPKGQLVFAEFHPVVWMFDDEFSQVKYRYFNDDPIIDEEGTYTDGGADIRTKNISWNHGISEVLMALINSGLTINQMNEFDYSPYNCFSGTEEISKGKYVIKKLNNNLPMVYSVLASK